MAGCGTDAAPFYRVFNPVTQGRKFDPDGDYVRAVRPGAAVGAGRGGARAVGAAGRAAGRLPERIVDHAAERQEALARYERVRR